VFSFFSTLSGFIFYRKCFLATGTTDQHLTDPVIKLTFCRLLTPDTSYRSFHGSLNFGFVYGLFLTAPGKDDKQEKKN
jgi:hypothetical protein